MLLILQFSLESLLFLKLATAFPDGPHEDVSLLTDATSCLLSPLCSVRHNLYLSTLAAGMRVQITRWVNANRGFLTHLPNS